jgi:hypothetical protein
MLVAVDPEDEQRRVLAMTKANLAREARSLAYHVISDEEHDTARIVWDGYSDRRADELLAVADSRRNEYDDAVEVLAEILGEGAVRAPEVFTSMVDAGFSKDQAKTAKRKLGARSRKYGRPGDVEAGWEWDLPTPRREYDTPEESEGSATQNGTPLPSFDPSVLPSHDDDLGARTSDEYDEEDEVGTTSDEVVDLANRYITVHGFEAFRDVFLKVRAQHSTSTETMVLGGGKRKRSAHTSDRSDEVDE